MRSFIICTHPQILICRSNQGQSGEESLLRFGERPEGKRLLGRPGRRWEDGIRMELREIGWRGYRVDPVGSG
jgi:hypothetical protein